MTPFVFDTLSASKRLREAGMEEGVAEAVVSVFQHAATTPDISHLATKADLDTLRDWTKAEIDALRAEMATKSDLQTVKSELRNEILATEARVLDIVRQQGWAVLGGVAVIVTLSTVLNRAIP